MSLATISKPVEEGDLLLVRGQRATPASPDLANAIAVRMISDNRLVKYRPIDGLGDRDLQAMANGPIMDPNRIYLPAGKCSVEEMRRRER